MYRPILIAALTVASVATGSLIAHGRDAATVGPIHAVGSGAGTSASAVDDAVATAVIGSISGEFDTDDVTVQLGDVDVVPLSERDRQVEGAGRLRIDGDPQWIPFRFAALYDTESSEVTHPRLQLGGAAPTIVADAGIADGLESRVALALASEFSDQPVAWNPATTTITEGGDRIVRVSGTGLVDFGVEGRVDAHVEALYDRRSGRWLRVTYELDPAATEDVSAPVVASL